jgi:hypothetical protein
MRISRSAYNWLSIIGFIIAVNSTILILALFIQSLFTAHPNPYNGIFAYIVLPVILVVGLLLIPFGMILRRRKTAATEGKWPVLDLNNAHSRQSLIVISIFTFLFLIVSAMGSYEAFNYTESVDFCGKLCHQVMEPEHTTYLHSPHARVACVECHVGEGAGWYVKSKLSGLYQVYSVIFHKYHRPIGTPLENLRPARETCERCHWPQKFYSRKLVTQKGYLTDSINTEWNISMLMRIGPSLSAFGLKEGIHWHINPNVKIEYIAGTKDRESIPWVKYTDLVTGKVRIFNDTANMLDKKGMDTLEHRVMDCMDCHNRPSHSYKSAPVYIDDAIVRGTIPRDLPLIKRVAMNVLKGPFTDKDSSLVFIRDSVTNFYRIGYPVIFKTRPNAIKKAIEGIQEAFSLNVFPFMRANSSAYLNHIGHLESDGCFRCHSDRHRAQDGKVISKDCNLCHTIVAQGPSGQVAYSSINDNLGFVHPVDVKDNWKTYNCTECHRVLYP